MASYDRTIPPGGEGKITVIIDTKGYQGSILKTAAVHTNDPRMSRFTLNLKAFVQVPVSVSPRYALLKGDADRVVSTTVEIAAGLEKPLFIEAEKSKLEGRIAYEIEEMETGRAYVIRFTSIPGEPGRFSGYLNLKTNYEERPMVNIPIRAYFTQGKSN